jgi:hypothetical protein
MSSTEAIQRAAKSALHAEIPMAAVVASNPDPSEVEEDLQADLDTAIGVHASSLDPMMAKILQEAMAAKWELQ